MQTVSSSLWTRIIMFISNDDDQYTSALYIGFVALKKMNKIKGSKVPSGFG